MADVQVQIQWDFVPGSLSTQVEYRTAASGSTSAGPWLLPVVPTNPTATNSYTLYLTQGKVYDLRLTTNGVRCGPKSSTSQITVPGNCCPLGWTLASDNSYCYQIDTVAATPPSSSENAVAENNIAYSPLGTLIYQTGFNINGTGPFIQIPYSNPFWVNGAGGGSGANTVLGPLNRTGLWSSTTSDGQTVGFTVCLPVSGNFLIGMAGDNQCTIKLNGNTIVSQDPVAMAAYLSTHGYPGMAINCTFYFWHVYPVSTTSNFNVLEVICTNVTGVAAMGCEVYKTTSAGLIAATSYGSLGSSLIFSSKDYIGQPIQSGSGGIGYSCPAGYSLVLCDGPAYCLKETITATTPC